MPAGCAQVSAAGGFRRVDRAQRNPPSQECREIGTGCDARDAEKVHVAMLNAPYGAKRLCSETTARTSPPRRRRRTATQRSRRGIWRSSGAVGQRGRRCMVAGPLRLPSSGRSACPQYTLLVIFLRNFSPYLAQQRHQSLRIQYISSRDSKNPTARQSHLHNPIS